MIDNIFPVKEGTNFIDWNIQSKYTYYGLAGFYDYNYIFNYLHKKYYNNINPREIRRLSDSDEYDHFYDLLCSEKQFIFSEYSDFNEQLMFHFSLIYKLFKYRYYNAERMVARYFMVRILTFDVFDRLLIIMYDQNSLHRYREEYKLAKLYYENVNSLMYNDTKLEELQKRIVGVNEILK